MLFPFADGVNILIKAGVKTIFNPVDQLEIKKLLILLTRQS